MPTRKKMREIVGRPRKYFGLEVRKPRGLLGGEVRGEVASMDKNGDQQSKVSALSGKIYKKALAGGFENRKEG